MKSKSNKRKLYKKSRKTRKTRKTRKSRKGVAKGIESCCICYKKLSDKENALIPRECLVKHGKHRAHKICHDCWWGNFAKEGVNHRCPGCVKGLPVKPDSNAGVVIDLTDI